MLYVILLIMSFTITYFVKNYYIKNALLDEINERSSHTIPTPHGGGIAIAITWFVGIGYLYAVDEIDTNLFYALLVGIVISIVSFFDDIYDLSPKIRLMIQSTVSVLGISFLGGLDSLNFGFITVDNQIVTNIIAFIAVLWFINLYNFLDGINGYAGAEMLFLSLAAFIFFGGNYFLVSAVAILGFLYWNWNQAKIFMGDVGSTLLGYNIAIFTIYYANIESTNLWIWIILFGLFWFDATLTLIRRKLNGEKLSLAHKKHAYQRLTQSGYSHLKVSSLAVLVNIFLFFIVYFISNILIAFVVALILLYSIVKFVDSKKEFDKL